MVRARRESITRSVIVTRMILTALPNRSIPPFRSPVRLLLVKRTWEQNQRSPVFIVKDFLTVP